MASYGLRIGFPTNNLLPAITGSYLLQGQVVTLNYVQGPTVSLSWTPPTQDENGNAITVVGHKLYASQFSDDWAGGINIDPGSATGSYIWGTSSFVPGTTWYFWVRSYDVNNSYSLPLYLGSKTF